jgi:hypothetical protein
MHRRKRLLTSTSPLAYDVPGFAIAHNIGESKTWEEINSRRLKSRKVGSRTIITAEDAAEWRANLPVAVSKETVPLRSGRSTATRSRGRSPPRPRELTAAEKG